MNRAQPIPAPQADQATSDCPDAPLAEAIAGMLDRLQLSPPQVTSLKRKVSEFATLSPCEQLTVGLSDGRNVALFLKRAESCDHPDKRRRDREALVYERLLQAQEPCEARPPELLPAPRYYGSHQGQLLLEFIDDWSLKYHELAHWFSAAARLADLHAHFAGRADALRACGFLLRLDRVYFHQWFERARVALGGLRALSQRLAKLAPQYASAASLLAEQPPTLVHNDLAPKNVLADRSVTPARICIVDWEMAGVGCGLLDLAHLKYGLDEQSDQEMVTIYRSRLAGTPFLPRGEREFCRVLAASELHKTVYRLAHAPRWKLPTARLERWVAEAERMLRRVVEP